MSYEILYRRQFVKVSDTQVIPMIEAGSNNCYEQGKGARERRAREWQAFTFFSKGAIISNNAELLNAIDAEREKVIARNAEYNAKYAAEGKLEYGDEYKDASWGYFTAISLYGKGTRGTSFGSYKNFFKLGIEQAKTIEELKAMGVSIAIRPRYWGAGSMILKPTVTFESTQHMIDIIAEYETAYKGVEGVSLYMDLSGEWALEQERIRRKQAKQKTKAATRVEVKNFWALKLNGNTEGYFVKGTRRGYSYSYYKSGGRKFLTEKAANAYLKTSRYKDLLTPVEIELDHIVSVPA